MKRLFDYIAYLFVMSLGFVLERVPIQVSVFLSHVFADSAYFLLAKRRRTAMINLDIAYGDRKTLAEKKSIARQSFRNMSYMVMELFLLNRILKDKGLDIDFKGTEAVEKAFKEEGKGVVLAISHLGAWEYLSFFSILAGRDWSVIVKNIKNPYLNRRIAGLRKELGIQAISKDSSIKNIFKAIEKNHGVALLIDQWAGPEGIWEDFFGVKTSTTSMPARIHLRHGTPLFFGACFRKEPFKYEIQFIRPCKDLPPDQRTERKLTQKINELLEELIQRHPEQWSWGHRRWKPKPSILRDPDTGKMK